MAATCINAGFGMECSFSIVFIVFIVLLWFSAVCADFSTLFSIVIYCFPIINNKENDKNNKITIKSNPLKIKVLQ